MDTFGNLYKENTEMNWGTTKMKTLIVYNSIHHGNTEKITKAMAKALEAKLLKPSEVNADTLAAYDLIGFGSGIYYFKHHKGLLNLVARLPELRDKRAFIFSTSGMSKAWHFSDFHKPLKQKLLAKGFDIIGEFDCRGWDTVGVFKLIGGISKSRPNQKDLERAENFAKELKESITGGKK